jgi:hypothetical protein
LAKDYFNTRASKVIVYPEWAKGNLSFSPPSNSAVIYNDTLYGIYRKYDSPFAPQIPPKMGYDPMDMSMKTAAELRMAHHEVSRLRVEMQTALARWVQAKPLLPVIDQHERELISLGRQKIKIGNALANEAREVDMLYHTRVGPALFVVSTASTVSAGVAGLQGYLATGVIDIIAQEYINSVWNRAISASDVSSICREVDTLRTMRSNILSMGIEAKSLTSSYTSARQALIGKTLDNVQIIREGMGTLVTVYELSQSGNKLHPDLITAACRPMSPSWTNPSNMANIHVGNTLAGKYTFSHSLIILPDTTSLIANQYLAGATSRSMYITRSLNLFERGIVPTNTTFTNWTNISSPTSIHKIYTPSVSTSTPNLNR